MANFYNLDEIKTALKKDLGKKESLLEAWQAVTFPTKKDGKPFATLSKNISGARLTNNSFSLRSTIEKKLMITTFDSIGGNGYVSDDINCYKYLTDCTEEQKAKTQNHAPHESMLVDLYLYDIEDIKEAVNARIEQLKEQIKELEKEIEAAETAYNTFLQSYRDAIKTLEKTAGKNTSLFYAIKDTITDRSPYC